MVSCSHFICDALSHVFALYGPVLTYLGLPDVRELELEGEGVRVE